MENSNFWLGNWKKRTSKKLSNHFLAPELDFEKIYTKNLFYKYILGGMTKLHIFWLWKKKKLMDRRLLDLLLCDVY